jgi:hypothetical protein
MGRILAVWPGATPVEQAEFQVLGAAAVFQPIKEGRRQLRRRNGMSAVNYDADRSVPE